MIPIIREVIRAALTQGSGPQWTKSCTSKQNSLCPGQLSISSSAPTTFILFHQGKTSSCSCVCHSTEHDISTLQFLQLICLFETSNPQDLSSERVLLSEVNRTGLKKQRKGLEGMDLKKEAIRKENNMTNVIEASLSEWVKTIQKKKDCVRVKMKCDSPVTFGALSDE